jgi:hypothetical protein
LQSSNFSARKFRFGCDRGISDFSALCARPGFMRAPGEIPMKVLMTKGFLAMRSNTSKPCLSNRELAGSWFTSMPVMPGGTGRRNRCQKFFSFTYFHGPSAARPLGWALRMTNGKVRSLRIRGRGQEAQGIKVSVDSGESEVREMIETVFIPAHLDPLDTVLNKPFVRTLHHSTAT